MDIRMILLTFLRERQLSGMLPATWDLLSRNLQLVFQAISFKTATDDCPNSAKIIICMDSLIDTTAPADSRNIFISNYNILAPWYFGQYNGDL